MIDRTRNSIARRDFLRGAATLAGASVLGPSAVARALFPVQASVALFYWDGERLLPADRLPGGDPGIDRVRLTIGGHGDASDLQALNAIFPVLTSAGLRAFPYHAWVAGGSRSRFTMPVDEDGNVTLRVELSGKQATAGDLRLNVGGRSGPKLREGVYVLVSGDVDLGGFVLDPKDDDSPLVDRNGLLAPFGYLTLAIERV